MRLIQLSFEIGDSSLVERVKREILRQTIRFGAKRRQATHQFGDALARPLINCCRFHPLRDALQRKRPSKKVALLRIIQHVQRMC